MTFKPNTDDLREAPSLTIIRTSSSGSQDKDSGSCQISQDLFQPEKWYKDKYEADIDTELVVLLTEWNEFRALNLSKISSKMKHPRLVDLRNIYSKDEALKAGFKDYVCVGR